MISHNHQPRSVELNFLHPVQNTIGNNQQTNLLSFNESINSSKPIYL